MIKLSIIILNYRSAGLVKQCLLGLQMVDLKYKYEVIVVDNNSNDGLEKIINKFSNIKFVQLKKNSGFAAGNNAGIKEAQGEYILLLNPDIAVLSGSIEKMVELLDQEKKAGMIVPQLLNPDRTVQESVMKFPSFWMPLYRRTFFGKSKKAKKILDEYLLKKWDHQNSQPIEWALGACLLVRSEALKKVGLLDERYFLYVEDTDWCRRFWQADWQIWYCAEAKMVHYHMRESAEKLLSRLNFIHINSWLKYFLKFKGKSIPRIN